MEGNAIVTQQPNSYAAAAAAEQLSPAQPHATAEQPSAQAQTLTTENHPSAACLGKSPSASVFTTASKYKTEILSSRRALQFNHGVLVEKNRSKLVK